MVKKDKAYYSKLALEVDINSCAECIACGKYLVDRCDDDCFSDKIIDMFESHGVLFPPVKLGQTIYFLCSDEKYIDPMEIHGISRMNDKWYICGKDFEYFEFEDPCIFLTPDEANEALRKLTDGEA